MKRILSIFIVLLLLVAIFASCKSSIDEPQNQIELMRNNPNYSGTYSTSLNSITKNNEPIDCSQDFVTLDFGITNGDLPAEYGFILFIDGVRKPFTTNEHASMETMQIIKMESNEDDRRISVTFPSNIIPTGRPVYANVATILNPNYKLKSTEYISFLPHHSLAAYTFYQLERTGDEIESPRISDKIDSVKKLPTEIESNYNGKIGSAEDPFAEDPSVPTVNSLDTNNFFEFATNGVFDGLFSYFTSETSKDLEVQLACLGINNSFRLSFYINHKLVPAFNGSDYCDVDTERDKLKIVNITVPSAMLAQLDEISHAYLIAVPLEPSLKEEDYDRPQKTNTNLLYISSSKKIKEFKDYLENVEDEPIVTSAPVKSDVSESKKQSTVSSSSVTTITSSLATTTTTRNNNDTQTSVDKTVSSSTNKIKENILEILAYENNSVLIRLSDGKLYQYDVDNNKIGSKTVSVSETIDSIFGGKAQKNARIQKIDNGFALYFRISGKYEIYNTNFEKIDGGKLPFSNDDEVEVCFSNNGKRIVYCVNEGAKATVYSNNLKMNDRKKILSLGNDKTMGAVVWLDEIVAYNENFLLFYGSYNHSVKSDSTTRKSCFGSISASGNILKQNDLNDNTYNYTGNHLVVTDNSAPLGRATDGTVEYWDVKTGKKSSFSFQKGNESRWATVSSGGKYIASQELNDTSNKLVLRIYSVSSKKLLFSKEFSSSAPLPMDFCENGKFAVVANNKNIEKITLS